MTTPRTFYSEFEECMIDAATDLDSSVMDFDQHVLDRIRQATLGMLRDNAGDGEAVINGLVSMNVWLFLTGREHAARGYGPPVQRTNADDTGIPNDLGGMFPEGQ